MKSNQSNRYLAKRQSVSLFQYRNYREYLQAYYESQKQNQPGFTYAQFSKQAGLGSPNYLKMVIDAKRNLTISNIFSFAKALRFSAKELEYFEALVLENQASQATERNYYRRRLVRFKAEPGTSVERSTPDSVLQGALTIPMLLCAKGRSESDAVSLAQDELGLDQSTAHKLFKKAQESLSTVRPKHQMMSDPKGLSERQKNFLWTGLKEGTEVFEKRYPKGAAKFLSLILTAPSGSLSSMFSEVRSEMDKIAERFNPNPEEYFGV